MKEEEYANRNPNHESKNILEAISSIHIFQSTLVNNVNRWGKSNVKKQVRVGCKSISFILKMILHREVKRRDKYGDSLYHSVCIDGNSLLCMFGHMCGIL